MPRSAELITAVQPDDRVAADLVWQLAALSTLHHVQLQVAPWIGPLPELTVIVVPGTAPDGGHLLDPPTVRHRSSLDTTSDADLVVKLHGRPGQELRGRMEKAPSEQGSIDPDQPPPWLAS